MLPIELALVSDTAQVDARELTRVTAALQKQASRDLEAIWSIRATVDAFVQLEDVPLGYWPIIIRDDIDMPGAAGIHLDRDGQPFALVQYSSTWSLTASHECVEMLVDPYGNRLTAGPSIKPDQGRVEYLVEVCDPSEAWEFGYTVNGVRVSDFYAPQYFDPVNATGVRYSFTGAIGAPREVLRGGYLSWHDPLTNHWWQQVYFGATKQFRDLGVFAGHAENPRATIDMRTPLTDYPPELVAGFKADDTRLLAASSLGTTVAAASNSKAAAWREQIEKLRKAV